MSQSTRFRVQAFYPLTTTDDSIASYIGAAGGIRETLTFNAAIKAVKELSEMFPACVHITITRGEFK
jgi:hypothetical protein